MPAMLGTWIDYSGGHVTGASMAAAGITGAVRYVGIGGAGKRLTRAEYVDHLAYGRQTIAVFEKSTTDADGGAAAGTANARAALADLTLITAGLAPIQFAFAANDQNSNTAAEVAYVRAAAAVLTPAGYTVGPYGFGAFLAACSAAGLCPIGWQAGPAPSRTGTAAVATFWQRQGGPVVPADGPTSPTTKTIDGVACDLNNQRLELPAMGLTDDDKTWILANLPPKVAGYKNAKDPSDVDMHQHAADATTAAKGIAALTTQVANLAKAVAALQAGQAVPLAGTYPVTGTLNVGTEVVQLAPLIHMESAHIESVEDTIRRLVADGTIQFKGDQ